VEASTKSKESKSMTQNNPLEPNAQPQQDQVPQQQYQAPQQYHAYPQQQADGTWQQPQQNAYNAYGQIPSNAVPRNLQQKNKKPKTAWVTKMHTGSFIALMAGISLVGGLIGGLGGAAIINSVGGGVSQQQTMMRPGMMGQSGSGSGSSGSNGSGSNGFGFGSGSSGSGNSNGTDSGDSSSSSSGLSGSDAADGSGTASESTTTSGSNAGQGI
jgi:hypothetical protein